MIACDDDYKDSDKTRCALVFVYDMLDYIQNSEGEFLHAGVNAPGINFLLVEPGAQMGELLTSQRTMIYELKSDEGSNIVEYDPDNFKSDCWQLSPVMKTIVLGTIFMLLIV
ncbi:uncharacterized protein LOC142344178 [Convolutriloba macropyga]|uniref:uncharacterized protein LOC142344178 n=1 Tax=Convolutriloba macropyga TaxID=536237 RepID=UPI003F527994